MLGYYTVKTARVSPQPRKDNRPNLMGKGCEDALRDAMLATHRPTIGEPEYARHRSGVKSKSDEARRDRQRRWRKSLERFHIMKPYMTRPMTAMQISQACGLPLGETSGTLKAMHKRLMVIQVGQVKNSSGNPTYLWEVAPNWFEILGQPENATGDVK